MPTLQGNYYYLIYEALEKQGKSASDASIENVLGDIIVGLSMVLADRNSQRVELEADVGDGTGSTVLNANNHERIVGEIELIQRWIEYAAKGQIKGSYDKIIKYFKQENPYDAEAEGYGMDFYEPFPASLLLPLYKESTDRTYESQYFMKAELEVQFLDGALLYDDVIPNFGTNVYPALYYAWKFGSTLATPTPLNSLTADVKYYEARVMLVIIEMYLSRAYYTTQGGFLDDLGDVVSNAATRTEINRLERLGEDASIEDLEKLKLEKERLAGGRVGTKEAITSDGIAEKIRFSEQTILMRNLKSFAENYSALIKARKKKYEKTYLMYGEPSEMVNKLTLKPGMSRFLNFKTHEISQLAPKFHLYQLIYDKDNKFVREAEYKFSGKSNISSVDSKNILESRGRDAVGVKSFEWTYIGTNPVTARNDLKAELKIFFQSFDDLFEERWGIDDKGEGYKYRYIDLILRNPLNEGEDVEESCSVPASETSLSTKQKPEKFETKVIVGWNFRGSSLEKYVTEDLGNTNISDLSYFNEVLFMTLIDHAFDIEEDGTFTLTVSYRARLDAMMQDKRSDILATIDILESRKLHEDEISELEKKCEQSEESRENLKKLKDNYEKIKQKQRQQSYQSLMDDLNGTGEDNFPSRLYHIEIDTKKFLEAGRKLDNTESYLVPPSEGELGLNLEEGKSNLASKLTTDPKEIDPKSPTASEAIKNAAGAVGDRANAALDAAGLNDGTVADTVVLGTAGAGAVATAPVTAPALLTVAGTQAVGAAGQSLYNDYQTRSIISTWNETGELNEEDINRYLLTTVPERDVNGNYRIHFFFFGDLIEMLAQRVMNSERQGAVNPDVSLSPDQLDNLRILLGSMEWYPIESEQSPYRCTLGAIPVSLQVFRNFFLRRVVAKKRDVYSLLDFMRDFLKYLLDDIMGGNSEERGGDIKLDVEIKSTVITMPGKRSSSGEAADPILEKILESKEKQISKSQEQAGGAEAITLNLDEISETNTIVPYTDPESNSANKAYHYFTIYVENKTPFQLRGNESDDLKKGIYHFHIGENRSIFKRASFKRTNAEYLREARFVNQHYNPLATLSNVYDAEIEMFGNTIFYPGQYLFINPFALGPTQLGFPQDCNSKANIMGLGGYHLVTGVTSVMDEDGFSTNVTARYETSGDGKKYDSRTQVDQPNCETPEATEIK